jgi:hypothetical protein
VDGDTETEEIEGYTTLFDENGNVVTLLVILTEKKEVTFEVDLSIANKKEITLKIGDVFELGNAQTGIDKFEVISAERNHEEKNAEDRMKAKIKNVDKGTVEDIKTRQVISDMKEDVPEPEPKQERKNIKRF